MKKLVSIIIVNWNGLRWLPDCFETLYDQNYTNFEIIFVDNASTDASVAWVKTNYPKTKIIVNERNLGFADANNRGYKIVKGQYILFLNNDTRVSKTFLTELIRVVETSSAIAGAQSKILLMDKPDTHDSIGAYLTPTGFLYHYGFGIKDNPKFNKRIGLYTAKGACMIFRKTVLDAVSLDGNIFEPDYFAYFEETDLCHRVWLAGYRIVYAYKSVIYHKMGATSTKMDNAFVQYHSFKNRINSYIKNLGSWNVLKILPLHIVCCELFALSSLLRGKIAICFAIHKAYWWNLLHVRETLRRRLYVQGKIRKVSDTSYWEKIFRKPALRYYWYLLKGIKGYEERY